MPISVLVNKDGAWQVGWMHLQAPGSVSACKAVRLKQHLLLLLYNSCAMQPQQMDGPDEEPIPTDVEQLREWVAYRVIGEPVLCTADHIPCSAAVQQ